MVGEDGHPAGSEQLDLAAEEGERIGDVMEHVPRDRRVERPAKIQVIERALDEGRPIGFRAAEPGPLDHLGREVDADHAIAGVEQGPADQPRAAAGVEDQRVGRQVDERGEPRQRRGVGLDGGPLEPGGLAVEGGGQGPVMVRSVGLRHVTRPR